MSDESLTPEQFERALADLVWQRDSVSHVIRSARRKALINAYTVAWSAQKSYRATIRHAITELEKYDGYHATGPIHIAISILNDRLKT